MDKGSYSCRFYIDGKEISECFADNDIDIHKKARNTVEQELRKNNRVVFSDSEMLTIGGKAVFVERHKTKVLSWIYRTNSRMADAYGNYVYEHDILIRKDIFDNACKSIFGYKAVLDNTYTLIDGPDCFYLRSQRHWPDPADIILIDGPDILSGYVRLDVRKMKFRNCMHIERMLVT